MAKLSIEKIGVNQGLAQIKTGEVYTVAHLDIDAKKVTLKNADGDEKVVSKATLERWYRELTATEVVEFGKLMKEKNGGSQDEVPESAESEQDEQTTDSTDADENDADAEDAQNAEEQSSNEDAEKDEERKPESAESRKDAEKHSDKSAKHSRNGFRGTNRRTVGDSGNVSETGDNGSGTTDGGSEQSETEVKAPITPSNAGKDKDKSKQAKAPETKNAALMKVRQTIIDTILADSPSIQLKKTTSYDVLKEKHNFAEITHGSNRFNVSIISKCLTEDQLNKVKVNPASFGWSIDADFTVFDETDIDMAVQLIRQSREYRLANPVTRKKKETK